MRAWIYFRKEIAHARADVAGLGSALAVPFLVVLAYRATGLDSTPQSLSFGAQNPLALILALAVWMACLTTAVATIHQERVGGTLRRLATTPFSGPLFVASKATILFVVGALQTLVVWISARLLIGPQVEAAPFLALVVPLAAMALAALALGIAFSAFLTSPAQASSAVTLLTLASITMSGFIRPVDELGRMAPVAELLPFTLGYTAVRDALGGVTPTTEPVLLVLEALLLLGLAAAAVHFTSGRRAT